MRRRLFISGLFILTALFYLLWWLSPLLTYMDYKFYDRLSHTFPSAHSPEHTVIVEIDDKSLKALGQWPWPRIITAKLIEKIADANPSAIVLDMVFSEPDRTSPSTLRSFYKTVLDLNMSISGLPESLQDNDAVLSDVIARSPIILPVFSNTDTQSSVCILPNSVTYTPTLQKIDLYDLDPLVCNLPYFQQRSRGIGHIHAAADEDGILRRLSLVMRHQDLWIPTLGIVAIASVKPGVHFTPTSSLFGTMQLSINSQNFLVDRHAEALLSFYPHDSYEKISAYDILNATVKPDRLKGKYVLIGSTANGLDSTYTMSDGSIRSGVFIHATAIENILNGDLAVQPSLYRVIHILVSFIIALALLIQMIRKRYMSVVWIFLTALSIAAAFTALSWHYHLYPSIGYFIVPLSAYLFILAMFMFFIDYRDKKIFIEEIQRAERQKKQLESALNQSELEIEYQKAMVLQQSKLAAMGEMIDNIAHQWRQPLNLLGTIVQHAEFAFAKGKVDGAYMHQMSTESMEQILFMSQTIEDFRNFVKPDRKSIPFDLNLPIQEALQLLKGMIKSNGITVNAEYSDTELMVMGSPSEFKQVIINLLQNAKDALMENNRMNPQLHINVSAKGENAIVTILDNGGGIPSAVIERIFEPYFTTKQENGGSGIGLYISNAIIRTKMG
ncbi:CHASE2 domain-containing protein, partial [Sulfuricurvum sp.]|uniref:CHASE2 domain-containing protein n=1 Tax=Sulfuricurvum sp. TaxID=2025608 RepID=UPI002D3E9216